MGNVSWSALEMRYALDHWKAEQNSTTWCGIINVLVNDTVGWFVECFAIDKWSALLVIRSCVCVCLCGIDNVWICVYSRKMLYWQINAESLLLLRAWATRKFCRIQNERLQRYMDGNLSIAQVYRCPCFYERMINIYNDFVHRTQWARSIYATEKKITKMFSP